MKGRLFDSSAIINLCGGKRVDRLLKGRTINLAFYELGNAVWKQVYLYKTLDRRKAELLLNVLVEVFNKMEKVGEGSATEVLNLAVKEGLTYYDAAYLQAAINEKLILVTDDERLYDKGKKYISIMTSDEL